MHAQSLGYLIVVVPSDARLRELDFAACVLGHFRWSCVITLVCVIDEQKLPIQCTQVSRTAQLLLNNVDMELLIT